MKKEYLICPFKIESKENKADDEFFYFEGYASTYGNVDLGDDVVQKGAFDKTLAEKSLFDIHLLYQHDHYRPVGVFESLKPDEKGLFARAKMPLENTDVKNIRALIKCGAINAMSIGYVTRESDYDDEGVRHLKEVDLIEISLVTMPMNPKAAITGMKSRPKVLLKDLKDIKSKRDFERCLRESGAFSGKACVKLASYFKFSSDSKSKIVVANQVKEIRQLLNDI